jgi:cysteine desulfurase / selenocysteine lyase
MRRRARPCAPSSTPAPSTRSSSPNATEAYNLVADCSGACPHIGEGDEIVLSIMEHHSNIVPWHFLRERKGAADQVGAGGRGRRIPLRGIREAVLTPRTKMVAITQMSNVLGTITPIKEIIRDRPCARRPGLVDGSAGAVHMPVDVRDLDAISTSSPATRSTGRPGSACSTARRDGSSALPPFQGGGEMIEEVTRTASPTTIRRTASRPARRRSSRRSGSARRSTT